MRKFKFIVLNLCIAMLISIVPVHAVENTSSAAREDAGQAKFSYIAVFDSNLKIEKDGKAVVKSSLTARNVDKIMLSTFLQKYENGSWTNLKHWTLTKEGVAALLVEEYSVESGYAYRVVSYGYVYGSKGEFLEGDSYYGDSVIY
jgi:hypothetical protein